MKIKYGILILAIIVCVAGGVYAAGTSSNPILNGILTNVLGSNSDHATQNDQAPTTQDNLSSDNGTSSVSNQDNPTPVVGDNVKNNIDTNNDNQPEEIQTIYLNSDNISNDGSFDPNYVRPNKTDNDSLGSVVLTSQK